MKFVRTKDVLRMLGVSRTTLWRMVQAGMFPQPVVISKRATGHVLEQVEAWMEQRVDGAFRHEKPVLTPADSAPSFLSSTPNTLIASGAMPAMGRSGRRFGRRPRRGRG